MNSQNSVKKKILVNGKRFYQREYTKGKFYFYVFTQEKQKPVYTKTCTQISIAALIILT